MLVTIVKMVWAFIILVPLLSGHFAYCQMVNTPPHFIPGSGDMSRFSLLENTPVDSPVYQLKGNSFIWYKFRYTFTGKTIVARHHNLISPIQNAIVLCEFAGEKAAATNSKP